MRATTEEGNIIFEPDYSRVYKLVRSKEIHSSKMMLCEYCGGCYTSAIELNHHFRAVHCNDDSRILCSVCGLMFSQDYFEIHCNEAHNELSHVGGDKLLCETCGSNFRTHKELIDHQLAEYFNRVYERKSSQPKRSVQRKVGSKICELCLVEVPLNRWVSHLRTLEHKRRSAVPHEEGFKVVKTLFNRRIETLLFENKNDECLDPSEFLDAVKEIALRELKQQLHRHRSFKFNTELFAEYVKMSPDDDEFAIKSFQTKMVVIVSEEELDDQYQAMGDDISRKMEEFQERDSGWALVALIFLQVSINKYQPLRGTNYLPLPRKLQSKKACVNVKNSDQFCFKWALISAVYTVEHHSDRTSSYNVRNINDSIITLANNEVINFENLEFPLQVSDIEIFERHNDAISIGVFGYEDDEIVGPYYRTKEEKPRHINLLLLQEGDKSHYVWIKNMSRLLRHQITARHQGIHICNSCLIHFHKKEHLDSHKNECGKIVTILPSPSRSDECEVKFDKIQRGIQVPFVIYADFECILQDLDTCKPQPSISSTTAVQHHVPCAFAYYIHCSYDSSLNKMRVYKGPDSPSQFVTSLASDVRNIYSSIIMKPKPIPTLTDFERTYQQEATVCHICKKDLEEYRVIDHCHLTGKYRGPAHNECNLLFRVPKFFPILLHNFSGYDCHLFVKALREIPGEIKLIPQNQELYVSLSKFITVYDNDCIDNIEMRFLDSLRFMDSSLEELAKNLPPSEFHNMKSNFPNNEQFQLLIRKGVFPYEYLNSWFRLDETELPSQKDFYSKLTESSCSEEDYAHAKKVWEKFNCRNLWDYTRIYLITDVLLLTDIFENFRKICFKLHSLDPCQYFTIPGFSWDAMLKYTGIKLDLLTDISMHAFMRRGIRGGLAQCSHRHSVANNKYMKNFDESKPSTFLVYLDANNLYGWAMTQPLPYGEFEWVENLHDISSISSIMAIPADSEIGYIFEVDLEYGKHLHDDHNDLPFCPQNKHSPMPENTKREANSTGEKKIESPTSKNTKLIADLTDKRNYIIYYKNLQQCIRFGLKLTKIHRAIKFKQSCWLKKYVDLNTYHRTKATNKFETDHFKKQVNAVYGKTMENVDKRRDVRIVTEWESSGRRLGARALIAKPNFHSATIFAENMAAMQLGRVKTFYNKPLYLGFVVLELSKWLMYDFHYGYMKKKFGKNLILDYTDTDSLAYSILTKDFYDDIRVDVEAYFDTSEYKADNPYNLPLMNKKKIGCMKDVNKGFIMLEFIGLKSKMYSIDVENDDTVKKAKGIKKTAVNNLTLENYRDCLYKEEIFYSRMLVFRSKMHEIYTQYINKVSLNHVDDKRFVREDGVSTYAWGHYNIPK